MKRTQTVGLATGAILFLLLLIRPTDVQAQYNLMVNLNNVKATEGFIMLAIYKDEAGFPSDPAKAVRFQKVPAQKGKVKVVLNKLPPGRYAVAVYHDANSDGILNTNMVGYPIEGFAFSNNVRPMMGAPAFSDAAFVLGRQSTMLNMDVIY